jgi:hypothetical protein
MSKIILISILIAIIAIPTQVARSAKTRGGLRKALVRMLIFEAFYAFALLYLWGRW